MARSRSVGRVVCAPSVSTVLAKRESFLDLLDERIRNISGPEESSAEEEVPSSGPQDGCITVLTGLALGGKLYLVLNKNNKNNISVLTVHSQITGRVTSSVLLFSTTSIMMVLSSMMFLAITPSQLSARLETE